MLSFLIIRLSLLAVMLVVAGCLFVPFGNQEPDETIELFVPVMDTTANGSLTGEVGKLELVNKAIIRENGKDIEYIVRRQSFGYWDSTLEYQWNLFLLQTNFFYSERLPQAKDPQYDIVNLYSQLAEPYTEYIDSSRADEFEQAIFTNTKPGAIGIMITSSEAGDTLLIKYVAPNSPAFSAGLQEGMQIVKVNDSSVTGDSALARFNRFTEGDSGTALTLTVLNAGSEETFSLVKDVVEFPTVLVDTIDNVPHIQIFSFTMNTIDGKSTSIEFREALQSTSGFPVTILDLRTNVGGSVGEVLAMCDEIIADGVIIHEEFRSLGVDSIPRFYYFADAASPGGMGEGRRYVLVSDRWSASASEIFISALMEALEVPLVGDTTFGKGIGQLVVKTPSRGYAKVTSLLLKSRSQNVYHGIGIMPTYPVTDSEALAKALEVALDMQGRPPAKVTEKYKRALAVSLSESNRRERIIPGAPELFMEWERRAE